MQGDGQASGVRFEENSNWMVAKIDCYTPETSLVKGIIHLSS
jgi:hypothetical protein